jgi:hypothetical protein
MLPVVASFTDAPGFVQAIRQAVSADTSTHLVLAPNGFDAAELAPMATV